MIEDKTKPVEPREENEEDEKQENTNPIVQVTQNIPEFIGTDTKKYNLRKGDVISMPQDMSNALSKRGAVQEIKS